MNKRKAGLLALVLFTVVAILYVSDWNNIINIPGMVLSVASWAFVAALGVYAWFKKSLTAWIMFSMVAGVLIGYLYPAFSQDLKFLRQIFLNHISGGYCGPF
jgi:proton glutamate symport protein